MLLLVLAGCSDPLAPPESACNTVFACQTLGVDLQVSAFELGTAPRDTETGLPIMKPESLSVTYTIRNIGSDTAKTAWLSIQLEQNGNFTGYLTDTQNLPVLPPGGEYHFAGYVNVFREDAYRLRDDRVSAILTADATGEAYERFNDNTGTSAIFHLATPLVSVTFSTPSYTFTAGDALPLNTVIRNYAKHADAPASTVAICLYEGYAGCWADYRTIAGRINLPAVPAGATTQFTTTVPFAHTAVWQDIATVYDMVLCRAGAADVSYLEKWPVCVSNSLYVSIRPNYTLCAPPDLTTGVAITQTGYNCGLRPLMPGQEAASERYRFHLLMLNAEANRTYVLQSSDNSTVFRLYDAAGLPLPDLDPAADRIRFDHDQRVYLVHYSAVPNLTVTAAVAP